jgi:hypothetical protein
MVIISIIHEENRREIITVKILLICINVTFFSPNIIHVYTNDFMKTNHKLFYAFASVLYKIFNDSPPAPLSMSFTTQLLMLFVIAKMFFLIRLAF